MTKELTTISSVEWVIKKLMLLKKSNGDIVLSESMLYELFQDAEEIHKEQIVGAFQDGRTWNESWDAETYYEELFNNLNNYE